MYESLKQLCIEEETKGIPFWQLVQMEDCKELQKTPEQSAREMMTIYQAMRASFEEYEDELQSASGLVGGAGAMIYRRRTEGALLCGDFIGCVMEKALKISESNACMKRIVAAPTAGSCGVVPAVFLSIQDQRNLSDEQMVEGLYVAGGLVYLQGGNANDISNAADMPLAGIVSRILADEVFDAMHNVGKHMDEEIRETAKGGLATTPTVMQFSENISMC